MNEAIQALHPPRSSASRRRIRRSASQDITSGIASLSLGSPKRSPSFHRASSTRSKKNPRFTELLLEHGERQLIDWAVSASSSSDRERLNQTERRMRLCSRSIVFEPRHSLKGIVRIPFRYMTGCPSLVEEVSGVDGRDSSVFLTFSSSRHFVVKANNAIGPYEQIQSPTDFRLDFLHSSPSNVASLTKQLFFSGYPSSPTLSTYEAMWILFSH